MLHHPYLLCGRCTVCSANNNSNSIKRQCSYSHSVGMYVWWINTVDKLRILKKEKTKRRPIAKAVIPFWIVAIFIQIYSDKPFKWCNTSMHCILCSNEILFCLKPLSVPFQTLFTFLTIPTFIVTWGTWDSIHNVCYAFIPEYDGWWEDGSLEIVSFLRSVQQSLPMPENWVFDGIFWIVHSSPWSAFNCCHRREKFRYGKNLSFGLTLFLQNY